MTNTAQKSLLKEDFLTEVIQQSSLPADMKAKLCAAIPDLPAEKRKTLEDICNEYTKKTEALAQKKTTQKKQILTEFQSELTATIRAQKESVVSDMKSLSHNQSQKRLQKMKDALQ